MRLSYDSTDSSTLSQPPADDIFVFFRLSFVHSFKNSLLVVVCTFVLAYVAHGVQYVQLIVDRPHSVLFDPSSGR